MVDRATVHTSYEEIVKAFGPHQEGDPDKVLAEWQLQTPHGWAEVYDYKSYEDRPEDVTVWRVAGNSAEAINWVVEAIDGRTEIQ
ncbi:hypothetical protein HWB05_gp090 [Streptomyces phage BRock]|uniref:Uncharacterized protein n=1 Tax=Streptomyces phage BRock TaxID=1913591 RepID=A0A1J0GVZ8_9CAUD|nr:hypothetical protein HWB05_gp090 [Streptomyces phage BRock]APC46352.1 hypothetical protein [Streptomyces phage BRock]